MIILNVLVFMLKTSQTSSISSISNFLLCWFELVLTWSCISTQWFRLIWCSRVCGAVPCAKGQQQQEGGGVWDDWVRAAQARQGVSGAQDILVVIMSSENVPTRIIPLPGGVRPAPHRNLGPIRRYEINWWCTLKFVPIYDVLVHVLRWNLTKPESVHDRTCTISTL
jgi:hypothetical protein